MVYKPRLVQQADGSYFQWANCTCASAATAIDRHTLGAIRTSGAHMRNCQYDRSGGTDLMDMKLAWSRCYSKYLDVRLKITWNTFIASVRAGRGAIVLGWYAELPSRYRAQSSASFGHAIYINEIRPTDGALLMYDPLNYRPIWVPQIYIKRFAGAMRIPNGRIGYGYVQTGFTRDTVSSATSTTSVTLRYGGVRITARTYRARVDAKQRRSPYIRTDNVVRTVDAGTNFRAYQKTTRGTNVGGSTTWYGNSSGTLWMHSSVVRAV